MLYKWEEKDIIYRAKDENIEITVLEIDPEQTTKKMS